MPAGAPLELDQPRLEHMGVRHIVEVPSTPAPDGRGVHYQPDALVAAVATVIAAHRQAAERTAAVRPGHPGWAAKAGLTRRNSI